MGVGRRAGSRRSQSKVRLLAEEGEDGVGGGGGHGGGGLDGGGDELAAGFAAEEGLELGGAEVGALEGVGVGVAGESAVGAVEGGGGKDLILNGFVGGGEGEAGGFGVEGGVVDEAGEDHAVDAVLAGLGDGEVAAELLGEGAELLLEGADVVVGVDALGADLRDGSA